MEFLLDNSGVATLPCSECQKWLYKIPSGVPETYEQDGKQLKIARPVDPGTGEPLPPPCDACPKGGPDNESRLALSKKNMRFIYFYDKLTTPAYPVPDHLVGCSLFAENCHKVATIMERSQRNRQANNMAVEIANVLLAARMG